VVTLPPPDAISALSDLLDRAGLNGVSERESRRMLPSRRGSVRFGYPSLMRGLRCGRSEQGDKDTTVLRRAGLVGDQNRVLATRISAMSRGD
jgi:hypothetical protein